MHAKHAITELAKPMKPKHSFLMNATAIALA